MCWMREIALGEEWMGGCGKREGTGQSARMHTVGRDRSYGSELVCTEGKGSDKQ
jgi:hypothetical protein